MTFMAQRLEIAVVIEQFPIALVRNDMVHFRGGRHLSLLRTNPAERLPVQMLSALLAPPSGFVHRICFLAIFCLHLPDMVDAPAFPGNSIQRTPGYTAVPRRKFRHIVGSFPPQQKPLG